jgi:PAS domain S-box-containing protein
MNAGDGGECKKLLRDLSNNPCNYIIEAPHRKDLLMSLVAAIKFITFLESLLLGGIVLRRAPRDGTSLLFAAYCFCIAASSFVEYQLVAAANPASFLFWKHFDTFTYMATIAMFHFSLRLAGWKGATTAVFNALLYGVTASVMVIEGFVLRPESIVQGTWGFQSMYGATALNVHTVFVIAAGIIACAIVAILFLCMKRAAAQRARNRFRILFITAAILVGCGASAEITVALFEHTELPLSITATSAFFLLNPVLAFALIRYNILALMPGAAAETVLRTMSDAVVLVEPGGIIEYANRSFCSLTGIPAERLIGNHFDQVHLRCVQLHEGDLNFAAVSTLREGIGDRECLIEREQGRLTPVSFSCTQIQRKGRPAGGFIMTLRDISERKRFEELRLGAERIMRHDLRNALNGILGFSSLLSMDQTLDPEQRENAQLIEQSARLMTDQIDAYLYLQAIEHGAFHPNLAPVDLVPVALHAMEMLASLSSSRNVRTRFLFNNGPVTDGMSCIVPGIKALIFGMMTNLIKNGLEAAPFGSMVTVKIDTGKAAVFSVHNFGVIPAEVRSRFFTQYVTFGKRTGTGLGTYSARLVAEALGGTIGFTTSEEAGTTVRVEFPAATADIA